VIHEAALPSVPRSVRDPITSNDVNVVGTLNVLMASRDAGVKRLVFASSSSVYGMNAALPKREDMVPDPISPYAVSKLAAENYCRSFTRLYGFETVILRYFNVFGPRQNPRSEYAAVIPRFIAAMLDGRAPLVYGDGTQTRDFTYIDNVVQATLLACEQSGAAGSVFNIATGHRVSLLDVIVALEKIVGRPARPQFASPRPGEIAHSCAAVDAARAGLGYDPRVTFEEGLARTVAAFRPADMSIRD
jgi:UDP-glucose 4-epimerase